MNKQTILTIGWLSIVSFFMLLFLFVILPHDLNQFTMDGQQGILDTRFFYQPHDVQQVVASYDQMTRHAYITSKFTVDLLWPLTYGSFLLSWLRLIKKHDTVRIGTLFIVCALIFDIIENISLALYVHWYLDDVYGLALLASVATPIKWMMLILSIGFIASGYIFHRKSVKLNLF